jgi:hypothetical protein
MPNQSLNFVSNLLLATLITLITTLNYSRKQINPNLKEEWDAWAGVGHCSDEGG